ncbi:MAG: hydrogenase maturation protease [Nocardioides sp.]
MTPSARGAAGWPAGWSAAELDRPGTLVYGVGNLGRRDDGLGWAFVDALERPGHAGWQLHRGYQLQIEDADLIASFARVLVVDATRAADVSSYQLGVPAPAYEVPFTSHALTVPTVLATCRDCFGRLPEVRTLAIRGHAWDLRVGLTQAARRHLADALEAFAAAPAGRPTHHLTAAGRR